VQEKAADELGGVERHGLEAVAAFDPVALLLEGDAVLVERDDEKESQRGDGGVDRPRADLLVRKMQLITAKIHARRCIKATGRGTP
jgi:hypothetical protein